MTDSPSSEALDRDEPGRRGGGLTTVSLRLRVTVVVLAVLALMLIGLSLVVDAVFAAQSERNLDAVLTGRIQLARQLARSGVGPQALVNRVAVDSVSAQLRLRNGTEFGAALPAGDQVRTRRSTLHGPGRINRAELTVAVDTSLVAGTRDTLRRVLLLTGASTLAVSAALVVVAVRVALRPLTTMARLARTIADGERGSRLDPTRTDTELGRTAAAFDDMLDELEGAESRARTAEGRTREFLADAAHELRTPITGVRAAAETLLQSGTSLDPDQRERLEVLLVREAERAGQLVSDLLAAARLDTGVDLVRAPVSLAELAAAEVERARLLRADATVQLQGADVVVRADRDRLAAIIRNLVNNALKAAGAQGQVTLTVRREPGNALLEVADSGPGVPPRDRELIFERLVRLDTGRDTDTGGSGLGLAIARGYARAHGGDLTCEDSPSGGALFRLRLPA